MKTYPSQADLDDERRALDLSEFARLGGIPAPPVLRSVTGALLTQDGPVALSVSAFVAGSWTAEGGLGGDLYATVGELVGRLHRLLAGHPAGPPRPGPTDRVCRFDQATRRLDRLLDGDPDRTGGSPFARWARDAARQRRADLASVRKLLAELPPTLTMQTIHGDLASPNLLLTEAGIAALIDFRPPSPQSPAWELGRIVLDPRTVLADAAWPAGLASAVAAYHATNPALPIEDLIAAPRLAAGYLCCSVYPLSVALEHPTAATPSLYRYARARHDATSVLVERTDEAEQLLRDLLG